LYPFRDTASYLAKFATFDLPHLHLAPPLGVTPFEFRKDDWRQNTRVPGLSCDVVRLIPRVAVLIQYLLVTDRHTDTGPWHTVYTAQSIARAVKMTGLYNTQNEPIS